MPERSKASPTEKTIEAAKTPDQSFDRFDEDALSRMDDEGGAATSSRDMLKKVLWTTGN